MLKDDSLFDRANDRFMWRHEGEYYVMKWPFSWLSTISCCIQKFFWLRGVPFHSWWFGECTPNMDCCKDLKFSEEEQLVIDQLIDASLSENPIVYVRLDKNGEKSS